MNKFNAAHLSDHHRNKYLEPMTNALGILGYDVHVMCVPKMLSSDLPILTDGNVSITRAKVIIKLNRSLFFNN